MKNLRIGIRLGIGFAAVLILTVIIAGIGVLQIKYVSGMTKEMT